jgi:crotonobetainyl-CoA:carnitine CoA-transferase CaiB-like acyl-CoA transferase
MADSLLSGFCALDLTNEHGFVCGKILAALGVETIKIEKPGGDPGRLIPPFLNNQRDPTKSLFWHAYNTDKQSVTLDIDKPEGRDVFRKMVARADFVFESFMPGYLESIGLGYADMAQINPRIILTSITPFGQNGPYASYKGGELIMSAMSGTMSTCGDADRAPLKEGPDSIFFESGAAAALGTVLAHFHCQRTGVGQHVDLSMQETTVKRTMTNLVIWEFDKRLIPRSGTVRIMGARATHWIWPCKDGYVFWSWVGGKMGAPANAALSHWMDEEEFPNPLTEIANWEEFDFAALTPQNLDRYQQAIRSFFIRHARAEIADESLRRRINACAVTSIEEALQNEQLTARGFWTNIVHPDGASITYPKYYFLSSETENFTRRRAPLPGEDTEEILPRLTAPIQPRFVVLPDGLNTSASNVLEKPPLSGIKVLDFGWALAGSTVGKYLADQGADVIRVESISRPDLPRSNLLTSNSKPTNPDDKPWFTHHNSSKMSLCINYKHPRARTIIEKLIRWADIVNENYTPGTMAKLGWDYDSLKAMNPNIIMISSSAYGQTGPMAQEWGVDGTGAALSGYAHLTGWPDREPLGPNGPYGDMILPFVAATAVVSALNYRDRTGKGQHIDVGMLEVCAHQCTAALLDAECNHRRQTRNGNRIKYAAPHGAFPCKGQDRWCAIAVRSEDEWDAFCHVLGNPEWTKQVHFVDLAARKENEDTLEELVASWTINYTAEEVMKRMQSAGVPAGVVQTMEDIVDHDPQLRAREFLLPIEHPVLGTFGHPTPPFKLSKSKARVTRAPLLGEHNEYICTQLLGMSDEEFVELVQQDVFV